MMINMTPEDNRFYRERTMKTPVTTTLNTIRSYAPCQDGWEKLLKSLGKTQADDEPLPLTHILKSNGIEHATWCLRCLPGEYRPLVVRFAADCADHVLHVWETRHPDDLRPRRAVEAARRWANSPTQENKNAAHDAAADACAAADAAAAAYAAAADAADAADAICAAADACAAAYAADAVCAAAYAAAADADAAYAADAVCAAADAAAAYAYASAAVAVAAYAYAYASAAAAAGREYQATLFVKYFGE